MNLERFLTALADALDAEGIPAMLTGSIAAAVRGASRATMDVDLVIDPTPTALERFVARMESAGFYVSIDAARDALQARSMFNVIDSSSGWKADLIVRKARSFSETEFARREPADALGVPIAVVRVEDLIIAKLEWAQLGASARQLEDVRALIQLAGPELDRGYLTQWIETLGLSLAWEAVDGPPGGGAHP